MKLGEVGSGEERIAPGAKPWMEDAESKRMQGILVSYVFCFPGAKLQVTWIDSLPLSLPEEGETETMP